MKFINFFFFFDNHEYIREYTEMKKLIEFLK